MLESSGAGIVYVLRRLFTLGHHLGSIEVRFRRFTGSEVSRSVINRLSELPGYRTQGVKAMTLNYFKRSMALLGVAF